MSHPLPCNKYIVCHRDGTKEIKTKVVTKESVKTNPCAMALHHTKKRQK